MSPGAAASPAGAISRQGKRRRERGSPLFYLRRALQPTPALQPIVSSSESVEGLDPNATEIVVAPGPWNPAAGAALRQFAEKGGLVLALPSSDTTTEAFAALTGRDDWKLSEATVEEFSLLADLDFDHPVLELFARAQIRDFTKIRFWKHRKLALGETPLGDGTRVLATFDGKPPPFSSTVSARGPSSPSSRDGGPRKASSRSPRNSFRCCSPSSTTPATASARPPTVYVGENKLPGPGVL